MKKGPWKAERVPLIAHEYRFEVNRHCTKDRGFTFTETYAASFKTEEAAEEMARRLNTAEEKKSNE